LTVEKQLGNWSQAKQIGLGYIVVLVFLGLFAIILLYGHMLHTDLEQPTWALAIAFILILPIFVPSLLRYLAPRITGIKIGNILELTLQQMEESSYSVKDLETTFGQLRIDVMSAPEYENTMTSDTRIEIIRQVEKIKDDRYEVLVVDLKPENSWVSPNLYFLALLLLRKTEVKQVAFVDTTNKKYEFVGMSSPQEILETLGTFYPEYLVAANSVCIPGIESRSQPGIQPCGDVAVFFHTLKQQWDLDNIQDRHKERLTSTVLSRIMKNSLHNERVEYKDKFSVDAYRYIVLSENPYIAIIHDDELEMLVNRDKVALKISQEIMKNEKYG